MLVTGAYLTAFLLSLVNAPMECAHRLRLCFDRAMPNHTDTGIVPLDARTFLFVWSASAWDRDRLYSLYIRVPDWYTHGGGPTAAFESDLNIWKVLTACRLVLFVLAWLVVCVDKTSLPYRFSLNFEYEYNREEGVKQGGGSGGGGTGGGSGGGVGGSGEDTVDLQIANK